MRILGRLSTAAFAAAACLVVATVPAQARTGRGPTDREADIKWLPRLPTGSPRVGADVTFAGPYTTWDWPNVEYSDIEERLTVGRQTTADAHLFYAHQFSFAAGDGGYIGLQEASDTDAKIALFSVWSANGAKGRDCGTFEEGGPGFTCRIDPFNWRTGRTYELEVEQGATDSLGTWYRASVLDTVTSLSVTVGDIRVPTSWGGIQGWVSWTENFGPSIAQCSDLPQSRVLWQYPTAQHRTVTIAGHENVVHDADCRAKIKDVANGVRQIIRF